MNVSRKHVAVVGAGVAGLTVADALASWGVQVSLFEKTPFLGGHAIQLTCKATDACVKCGACIAEDKVSRVTSNPDITIHTGTQIEAVSGQMPFRVRYRSHSPLVSADQCNGCGICLQKCPVPGAILQGQAPRVGPYVAIRRDLCRYFENAACTWCRDACPQRAIHLSSDSHSGDVSADALVVATGFTPYNPAAKPYGYGCFQNVITSLDAERQLRNQYLMKRPADGQPVKRIAFIQCVGSRDAKLGHLWCSKICCGSSLRMARLIQSRQADAQITFFYIDVQTFGKDFQSFYRTAQENITMIRAIPGDITQSNTGDLQVVYFDPEANASREASFDIVVLSVGLLPSRDTANIAQKLDWTLETDGFYPSHGDSNHPAPQGVYTAGAVMGPMSIAESVGNSEKTVNELIQYLGLTKVSG